MKSKSIPKHCWKKLWKWCLKHEAKDDGTIHVSVLSSNRDGYYLLRTEYRKRIGRAVPRIDRYEGYKSITWSYVH